MRAEGPKDQIQFLGDPVELPKPRFAVGTRVRLTKQSAEMNLDYYKRLLVRQVLRDAREVLDRLQKQGFMGDMRGRKMPEHNKGLVRERLRAMSEADSVEIAGHKPFGMQVVGMVANQCYLKNGQCHSGVHFDAYLLFRRTDEQGRRVAYIHPHPICAEYGLEEVK